MFVTIIIYWLISSSRDVKCEISSDPLDISSIVPEAISNPTLRKMCYMTTVNESETKQINFVFSNIQNNHSSNINILWHSTFLDSTH